MTSLTKQLQSAEAGKYRLTPKMIEVLSLAKKCEPRPAGFYRDPRQSKGWQSIVGRWMLPSRPAMSLHALKNRGLAKPKFVAWIGHCWFLTEEGAALLSAAAVEGSDET